MAFSQGRKTILKVVGAEIEFTSNDEVDFTEYLRRFALRASDLRQPNKEFGEYIVKRHIPLQFQQQGTPKKWAKLNAIYAAWKRKHFGNLPILIRTGKMRAGFKFEATARSVRVVNKVRPKGGGDPYWQHHQTGTENMPQRMLIQLTNRDRTIYRDLVRDWLIQQTGGGVL